MNTVAPRIVVIQAPARIESMFISSYVGYEVKIFNDFESALESIAQLGASLCVLGDSFENLEYCIEKIRSMTTGRDLPVLVVSDRLSNEEVFKLGADAYFGAKETQHHFLEKIQLLLGLNEITNEYENSPSEIDTPFEKALAAASLLADPTSDTSCFKVNDLIISRDQSLLDFAQKVERQFQFASDNKAKVQNPEGLESIDVQGYIGQQLSISERMDYKKEPLLKDLEANEKNTDFLILPQESATTASCEEIKSEEVIVSIGDTQSSSFLEENKEKETFINLKLPSEDMTVFQHFKVSEQNFSSGKSFISPGTKEGNLKNHSFAMILAFLYLSRSTGLLKLTRGGITRSVNIEKGDPTVVTSTARQDRLVDLLYREGRLTQKQYESVSLTIGASGRRAGVILVERGIIPTRELFPTVRYHYESILFDSFKWTEGNWFFDPEVGFSRERIRLDVGAPSIIIEGMRMYSTSLSLDKLVPVNSLVEFNKKFIAKLKGIGISDIEQEVLSHCDAQKSVLELASKFDLDELELRAFFAGLVLLGWVKVIFLNTDEEVSEKKKDEKSKEKSEVIVGSEVSHEEDPDFIKNRVVWKMKQVNEGTYFELLEIYEDATSHEIKTAYERLKSFFTPVRFLPEQLASLHQQVKVINSVLDEAYEILSDSKLFDGYKRALSVSDRLRKA